ncbi:MAG: adenosylmethionine--8-amino-7-oxononanoate transaminase [Oceanococcaceae bacterium]
MASLAERDLACVWHPCTQMKDHESVPLVEVARGEGVWLYDTAGRRYLDAVSSWWVNIFGHAEPRIAEAIAAQARTLEHVIFAGHTHEPAVRLAERLLRLTPPGLGKVFFADNGSSAVEVALKMSFHYWRHRGQQRTTFVHLDHGYHGETLGALAVSAVGLYKSTYEPLLMQALQTPAPDRRRPDREADIDQCLAALEELLQREAGSICALILEPLVQCAAGMRMHEARFVQGVAALCQRYDVHVIADEIATGFGRTGTMFACEQASITPDYLCLSKGLTGGFLPLSVVVTRDSIYEAFYADWAEQKAFLHSHSYTGNPIACAAANAVLDIFEAEPVLERNMALGAALEQELRAQLQDHPRVNHIRRQGMVLALDMQQDARRGVPFPAHERRGLRAYRFGLEREALLRPLGDTMYLMPPYVLTPEQGQQLVHTLAAAVRHATRDAKADD